MVPESFLLMSGAMFNCREAARLAAAGEDRRLALRERAALMGHTMMCSACRAFGRQLRFLSQALKRADDSADRAAGGGLSPESKKRIGEALRRDDDRPK